MRIMGFKTTHLNQAVRAYVAEGSYRVPYLSRVR
jgi:hypothetical protein